MNPFGKVLSRLDRGRRTSLERRFTTTLMTFDELREIENPNPLPVLD